MYYSITPPKGKINTRIALPASKSISNRVLIIEALSGKKFKIKHLSNATDTKALSDIIENFKGNSSGEILFNTGDGGSTFRFMAAFFAIQPGKKIILTGSEQMNKRPIGPLIAAMKKIGTDIRYIEKQGFPPIAISGKMLEGGEISMDGSVSSQFITAVLMIAPYCRKGLTVKIKGAPASLPYITMTLKLMHYFGVKTTCASSSSGSIGKIKVLPAKYKPKPIQIEPDWSAASFWYEIAALSENASIQLDGLQKNSLQGDIAAATVFKIFGVETRFIKGGVQLYKREKPNRFPKPVRFNFANNPDLAIPFAMTCAGLNLPATLTGIKNLAVKESNRIEALIREIGKTGCNVVWRDEGTIEILQNHISHQSLPLVFDTYNDHRMAMAAAPLALKFGTIGIRNPHVTAKSYPGFWKDINKAGFTVENLKT